MTSLSTADTNGKPSGRRDIAVGLALTAIGAGLYFYAIPTWIQDAPSARGAVMSPRFMPNIIALGNVVLGLAIATFGFLEKAPASPRAEGRPLRGLAVTLACIAIYFGLIDFLGAMIVAILVSTGLQLVSGERRWPVLVIGGAIVPIIAVFILKSVANVPLPGGFLDL